MKSPGHMGELKDLHPAESPVELLSIKGLPVFQLPLPWAVQSCACFPVLEMGSLKIAATSTASHDIWSAPVLQAWNPPRVLQCILPEMRTLRPEQVKWLVQDHTTWVGRTCWRSLGGGQLPFESNHFLFAVIWETQRCWRMCLHQLPQSLLLRTGFLSPPPALPSSQVGSGLQLQWPLDPSPGLILVRYLPGPAISLLRALLTPHFQDKTHTPHMNPLIPHPTPHCLPDQIQILQPCIQGPSPPGRGRWTHIFWESKKQSAPKCGEDWPLASSHMGSRWGFNKTPPAFGSAGAFIPTGKLHLGSPWGGSAVKSLPANAGDSGFIPGSGRSPGGGNGNPLQYSCLGEFHG